jgi:hypothetical protein
MKGWRVLAVVAAMAGLVVAQPRETGEHVADRERLVGAWRLVHIDSPGPDGKAGSAPQPEGMMIYTRDGHMSVQLMYPQAAGSLSNQYVKDGYEASFGSYDVDEARHTVTHHVLGSNTGSLLVGKDLPRRYSFTAEGRLLIEPVSRDEHWSVAWQHY